VSESTIIALPPEITEPFQVFVNGGLQTRGADFELRGRSLVFPRILAKQGKLRRVRRLFLVFAGNYRKHEAVDVSYERDGHRIVATGLESEHK
jgi:hypothetical protein